MRWSLALAVLLMTASTACTADEPSSETGSRGGGPEAVTQADTAPAPGPGPTTALATWTLEPGTHVSTTTRAFRAAVTRVACNGGVTGRPDDPAIAYTRTRVTVTFRVRPPGAGFQSCQGNRSSAYEVVLKEPIGDRSLVDGACLLPRGKAPKSLCKPPVRWTPGAA